MRVLLSTYESREDLEPMMELAVQSQALGAVVAQFVALLDAPVATTVMPTGVWP
jgi:hypothetical protein